MKTLAVFLLIGVAIALAAPVAEDEDNGMRELETQDLGLWGGDMAGINSEEEEAERWNAIINKGQKWPNGVIPYVFDSGAFSSSEQSLINSALSSFSSRFRCLKAVPRTRERYYVKIIKGSGCWSMVGCTRRANQQLSIGPRCLNSGIIQHEFYHAAGFSHEHQREDRDRHVTINLDNVDPRMASNFRKVRTDYLGTPYDYSSIMHYGRTAFSKNGLSTIVPKDRRARIGGNTISSWDVERARRLYC